MGSIRMSYSASSKVVFVGKKQPYKCEVCQFVLRDIEDVKSAKEHGACTNCVMVFKYVRYDDWENGWRPTISEARSA